MCIQIEHKRVRERRKKFIFSRVSFSILVMLVAIKARKEKYLQEASPCHGNFRFSLSLSLVLSLISWNWIHFKFSPLIALLFCAFLSWYRKRNSARNIFTTRSWSKKGDGDANWGVGGSFLKLIISARMHEYFKKNS